MILDALRSFPRDTAPGPSGLRVQHLLDSLTPGCKVSALEQLAACAVVLARGEAPPGVAPFFAGASLMALEKKPGGLRPIAVGEVFRRMLGKILCKEAKESIHTFFWPRQVGVGSPLGTDCAVHSVRQRGMRNKQDPRKVVLKLDFENAFNTVDRAKALEQVRAHFPSFARWAHWCMGITPASSSVTWTSLLPRGCSKAIRWGRYCSRCVFILWCCVCMINYAKGRTLTPVPSPFSTSTMEFCAVTLTPWQLAFASSWMSARALGSS